MSVIGGGLDSELTGPWGPSSLLFQVLKQVSFPLTR